MHSLEVTDSIVEFLTETLSDMQLQTKDENVTKAPTIHDGYLPPKKNVKSGQNDMEQDDYPFVIVRYLGEKDVLFKENTMQFRLLVGTYNKDEQHGWREALGVMNRIKIALKETQIIGAANLTGTVETSLFEEQMRPTWHGIMDIEFETPQVQLIGVNNNEYY